MRPLDLVGQKFGRLLVIERVSNSPYQKTRFRCVCDCGKEKIAASVRLKNGSCQSCGCFQRDGCSLRFRTHNQSFSPEYKSWDSAKQRCYDLNHKSYRRYGGRGIKMSDDWKLSFESFLKDMGKRPGPGYSLERKDVNGNYCKENCCWIPQIEQQKNRHNIKMFEHEGIKDTATGWSKRLGLPFHIVWRRVCKNLTIAQIMDEYGLGNLL